MAVAMATVSFPSSQHLSSSTPISRGETFTRHSFNNFVVLRSQSQFPGLFCNEGSDLSSSLQKNVQGSGRHRLGQKMSCRARFTMMPVGVPYVTVRIPGGGEQLVDIRNALYRERIMFLSGWIDENYSNQILATLLYLDSIDYTEDLCFFINGQGGDITPCMSIFDTMESLRSPIGTMCIGQAYNLSAFLLSAGRKGQRWAFPLSRMALYPIAGAAWGRADAIQNESDELLRIRDHLFQKLALKTGQPFEKIKEDLKNPKYFTPQQAIEYGIVDQIARPPKVKVKTPEKQNKRSDLD